MDRQAVAALIEKFLHHRYGHRSSGGAPTKYKELAQKLVRSDDFLIDIDAVDPNQLKVLEDLVADFSVVKTLTIHSDRLGPGAIEKFWLQVRKMLKLHAEGQADFFSFRKQNLWYSIRRQQVIIKKKPICSDKFNFEVRYEPDLPDNDTR